MTSGAYREALVDLLVVVDRNLTKGYLPHEDQLVVRRAREVAIAEDASLVCRCHEIEGMALAHIAGCPRGEP